MNKRLSVRRVVAMSRGVVVVDENVSGIESELRARNIRVVTAPQGTSDEVIKRDYLPGRIFITANSKHFIDDASSYEYGIVSLDKIKFKDSKSMAELVSGALTKNKLWSRVHGFIIELDDNGKGVVKNLID